MHQRQYCISKILGLLLLAAPAALLLGGCGEDASSGTPNDSPDTAQNLNPQISGAPRASVAVGQTYSFQPSAADQNGDDLTYSVLNPPAWTAFDAATGLLAGTPTEADVGMHSDIIIRVSDGLTSTALPAFSITVTQISTGSATLSWLPPTQNTDGSPLTDLAGFQVNYGLSISALDQQVTLSNPGLTTYVLENLSAGTWYFALRAYAADGEASGPSTIASKTIS